MNLQPRPLGRRRAALLAASVFALLCGVASAEGETVVNVNTATLEELQALPGVGEARARAILEARKARGGFAKVDELVDVKGIGPAGLERMRPFARIAGPTQIEPER